MPTDTVTDADVEPVEDKAKFERLARVVGSNPNTGATNGLIDTVASDPALTELAVRLRTVDVGTFQALASDHRTVEASCRAAVTLRDLLDDLGLELKVKPKPKVDDEAESGPKADSGRTTSKS